MQLPGPGRECPRGPGRRLSYSRRIHRAKTYLTQALAIWRAEHDRKREGWTLGHLGNFYYALSQYDQALKSFEQALDIVREVGDRSGEGTILHSLGVVYNTMGQYDQALAYLTQALAIWWEGDRPREGQTLGNLGVVYHGLSQYT